MKFHSNRWSEREFMNMRTYFKALRLDENISRNLLYSMGLVFNVFKARVPKESRSTQRVLNRLV